MILVLPLLVSAESVHIPELVSARQTHVALASAVCELVAPQLLRRLKPPRARVAKQLVGVVLEAVHVPCALEREGLAAVAPERRQRGADLKRRTSALRVRGYLMRRSANTHEGSPFRKETRA